MVLSNGIGCELHANALSIIVLCFVKHLQALGNCFRALLSLKYQLEIDFDQFWLTANKVSESTLEASFTQNDLRATLALRV